MYCFILIASLVAVAVSEPSTTYGDNNNNGGYHERVHYSTSKKSYGNAQQNQGYGDPHQNQGYGDPYQNQGGNVHKQYSHKYQKVEVRTGGYGDNNQGYGKQEQGYGAHQSQGYGQEQQGYGVETHEGYGKATNCYQCTYAPPKYVTKTYGHKYGGTKSGYEGDKHYGGYVKGSETNKVQPGWDKCKGPFDHYQAKAFGIDVWKCHDNCYVRKDPNGHVFRGCYKGEFGVNPNILGCSYQQGSLYCFCKGDKCNNFAAGQSYPH
ncbi:unnamed protein product [Owenia fusiformis]|uniref:Uncharacterized protein n=1 Tax=Owenia fusiformis TaxID=6347 RepID=A0A8J1UH21_OWEFU|nr:unnamed protein product [Owenia fusiformis]